MVPSSVLARRVAAVAKPFGAGLMEELEPRLLLSVSISAELAEPSALLLASVPLESVAASAMSEQLSSKALTSYPLSLVADNVSLGPSFDKTLTFWDWSGGPWMIAGYGITDLYTSLKVHAWATAGTVDVDLTGDLIVTYPDSVVAGQQDVPVTIQFLPRCGATMSGYTGAGFDVTLCAGAGWSLPWPLPDGRFDFCRNLEEDWNTWFSPPTIPNNFDIDVGPESFCPSLGSDVTARGSAPIIPPWMRLDLVTLAAWFGVPGAGVIDLAVDLALGVDLSLRRSDYFTPISLEGDLYVGGGKAGEFTLSGSSPQTIYVDLPPTCGQDTIVFDVQHLELNNDFQVCFGLELEPYFEACLDLIVGSYCWRYDFPSLGIDLLCLSSRELPFSITDPPGQSIPVTEPEITVTGNGRNINDGDSSPDPSDGTDFGGVLQGQPGPRRTFRVRNDGDAPLTPSLRPLPPGFTLVEGLDSMLGPGDWDDFTVELATGSAETQSGDIVIDSNDCSENPFNFRIRGTVEGAIIDFDAQNPAQFLDENGELVVVSLRGVGSGQVGLREDGKCDPSWIVLQGTTSKSSLTIMTKGKGSSTSVGGITVNSSLKDIKAKTTDLLGKVSLGQSADPKAAVSMTFASVRDGEVDSGTPIKSFTALEWRNKDLARDETDDVLKAPWVGKLNIKGDKKAGLAGDFQADLELSGAGAQKAALGSVRIAGDLWQADWRIGDPDIPDIIGEMGRLTVLGTVADSSVRATGGMAGIVVGAANGANFLAGIRGADSEYAEGPGDFVTLATVGSFQVKGLRIPKGTPAPRFMVDSNVSAATLGSLKLLNVDFADSALYSLDQGGAEIGKIVNRDTVDPVNNFVYPPKPGTSPTYPPDFINIL